MNSIVRYYQALREDPDNERRRKLLNILLYALGIAIIAIAAYTLYIDLGILEEKHLVYSLYWSNAIMAVGFLIVYATNRFVASRVAGLFLAEPNPENMNFLKELAETGKLAPVIDKTYPLAETPDAFRYLETEHARGKVVICV